MHGGSDADGGKQRKGGAISITGMKKASGSNSGGSIVQQRKTYQ